MAFFAVSGGMFRFESLEPGPLSWVSVIASPPELGFGAGASAGHQKALCCFPEVMLPVSGELAARRARWVSPAQQQVQDRQSVQGSPHSLSLVPCVLRIKQSPDLAEGASKQVLASVDFSSDLAGVSLALCELAEGENAYSFRFLPRKASFSCELLFYKLC